MSYSQSLALQTIFRRAILVIRLRLQSDLGKDHSTHFDHPTNDNVPNAAEYLHRSKVGINMCSIYPCMPSAVSSL